MQLKYHLGCFMSFLLFSASEEISEWKPFTTEMRIPKVVDMRNGGNLDMEMGESEHYWGGGLERTVKMYGYGVSGTEATFPGPTIITTKNTPIQITWHNNISSPHILDAFIEPSLMVPPTACYPSCGVPLITHIHGMEVPAQSDGVPYQAVYTGRSKTDTYNNSQMSSTHVYHDHAMGLTRLNAWSGLLGGYIIEDPDSPAEKAMSTTFDIPLIITDTIISNDASLSYPVSYCTLQSTKWVPEAYGTVNAVNGVVMPFLKVPQQQTRLRLINGANSRNYGLAIPFYELCQVIASDMGLLNKPYAMSSADELLLFPLERVELMCDFRNVDLGTVYNVTDYSYAEGTEQTYTEIFQLRVVDPPGTDNDGDFTVPSRLNNVKNLQELYESTEVKGATRNITLQEVTDEDNCPIQLLIYEGDQVSSFLEGDHIECIKGTVEKWNFYNPTADVHPFHWHAIAVQCGPSEDEIDSNALKDTVPIPNAKDEFDTITQTCYVACTPNAFLEENSETKPDDFAFDTSHPYVVHCHMLEHEENAMMTYFVLADKTE